MIKRIMRLRIICAAALILAGILVFPCISVSASNGETTLAETDDLDVDVYAKAIYNWPENCYIADAEDGSYMVETEDGMIIIVTPESPDASLRLVVYQVVSADSEAYAWIMERTEGLGSNRLPYEIYFIDESGNRVEIGNASITITLPDGYGEASVYQVASSGTASLMSSSISDGAIRFTASGNGFYVLVYDSEKSDTMQNSDNGEEMETTDNGTDSSDKQTETDDTGSAGNSGGSGNTGETGDTNETDNRISSGQVKTGDDAPLVMWFFILMLAAMFILVFQLRRSRK